jgi:hypothetical protein
VTVITRPGNPARTGLLVREPLEDEESVVVRAATAAMDSNK